MDKQHKTYRREFSMSLWFLQHQKNKRVPGYWRARRACAASIENIRTSCSIEVAGGKSKALGAACRGGPMSWWQLKRMALRGTGRTWNAQTHWKFISSQLKPSFAGKVRKEVPIYRLKVSFTQALGKQRARFNLWQLTQLWATTRRDWIIRQAAQ